jgi:hypothetical protein
MDTLFKSSSDFPSLSLKDLVEARDLFHYHLMNKKNVVATAVGLYRIRKTDPWPSKDHPTPTHHRKPTDERRTLFNSEVRFLGRADQRDHGLCGVMARLDIGNPNGAGAKRRPDGNSSQGAPASADFGGGSNSRCEGQPGTTPTQLFHARAIRRRAAALAASAVVAAR